jgi:hypothetical protein
MIFLFLRVFVVKANYGWVTGARAARNIQFARRLIF